MEKYLKTVEQKLMPLLAKVSEQKHLKAVRDGIISVLPLIIAGSFFLLLGQLPVDFLKNYKVTPETIKTMAGTINTDKLEKIINKDFLKEDLEKKLTDLEFNNSEIKEILAASKKNHSYPQWVENVVKTYGEKIVPKILLPYRLTMGLIALFAAFGIAYNLAGTYELDGLTTGILSSSAFLLTVGIDRATFSGGESAWALPLNKLGGQGLFVAIFCAFFTVEITRIIMAKKLFFSMPDGVPPAVTKAFASLVPGIAVLGIIWMMTLSVDIHAKVADGLKPLVKTGDGLVAIITINLLLHLIWLTGIHGVSVINAVALPFWLKFLEENAAAQAAGQALPHVTSLPFYQWFIWIGGSGATLSLVILLITSKSDYLKKLGRVALLPSICNINEPIIFGLPIVMNPIIAIPFITAPIVSGVIAYIVVKVGIVQSPYIMAPWTLPAPLGAFVATGFDWKAIVLVIIIMFINGLIYYPFFKKIEQKALEREASTEE